MMSYIKIRKGKIDHCKEVGDGQLIIDFDKTGRVIGIEIFGASKPTIEQLKKNRIWVNPSMAAIMRCDLKTGKLKPLARKPK